MIPERLASMAGSMDCFRVVCAEAFVQKEVGLGDDLIAIPATPIPQSPRVCDSADN